MHIQVGDRVKIVSSGTSSDNKEGIVVNIRHPHDYIEVKLQNGEVEPFRDEELEKLGINPYTTQAYTTILSKFN